MVLEIVVGDYVLTVNMLAPWWSLDRGVRAHAPSVKKFHENVGNFFTIISSLQTKVQLEVITVLGENKCPVTPSVFYRLV